MIEFGQTLRDAREAKGYDLNQLAELTKMAPRTIRELENEDFTNIAAPIYGRGFVKLYCAAVGIDPKPLLEEFMSIYNGERNSVIREREPEKSEEAEPPPAEQPSAEEPAERSLEEAPRTEELLPRETVQPGAVPAADELRLEGQLAAVPVAAPAIEEPPVAPPSDNPQPNLSRYAAPVRTYAGPSSLSPALWRMGLLGLVALGLLFLIGMGIRAVYRATTPERTEPTVSLPVPKPTEAAPRAAKAAPRTPQRIPSLFLN